MPLVRGHIPRIQDIGNEHRLVNENRAADGAGKPVIAYGQAPLPRPIDDARAQSAPHTVADVLKLHGVPPPLEWPASSA